MKNGIVGVVLCLVVAVGLVACGGGGGGGSCTGCADTMSVSVAGNTAVTYTEGQYNAYGYLDPNLTSDVTSSGNTYVSLSSGVTPSGSSTASATLINISIKGNTPGSYATGTIGSPAQISYRTNNETYLSVTSNVTGTISISSIGNVGEKVVGTFDAVVTSWPTPSDTFAISGTFSVKRDF